MGGKLPCHHHRFVLPLQVIAWTPDINRFWYMIPASSGGLVVWTYILRFATPPGTEYKDVQFCLFRLFNPRFTLAG